MVYYELLSPGDFGSIGVLLVFDDCIVIFKSSMGLAICCVYLGDYIKDPYFLMAF